MPRKPLHESPESFAERQILEAQARGEFENLPGAGKPLPGLDDPPDDLWWIKDKLRREQLSLLPEALQIRVEIDQALESPAATEAEFRERLEALNAKIARLNARVTSGPPTSAAPVDVEAAVQRWLSRQ